MQIYEALAETPKEAKKTIKGGRLNGFTDIKPMYRIKRLTEVFGPCGIGWKYVIKDQRLEASPGGEVKAFVDIDLFVKWDGQWSEAIPGIGGNAFISKEKGGSYVNDECFKSALSDAIGTACKSLGMCADVYYAEDRTKYTSFGQQSQNQTPPPAQPQNQQECNPEYQMIKDMINGVNDADTANAVITALQNSTLNRDDKKRLFAILKAAATRIALVFENGYFI